MSTPQAQPAINTLFQLGNGSSPEIFATVANVGSINGLSMSANVVDVTSHSTDIPWKQKIVTLRDAGDLSFDLYFIPADTGHKSLLSIFSAGTEEDFQLVFPDVAQTTWKFSGYISKFAMSSAVADVIKASVTITVTGRPTFPA